MQSKNKATIKDIALKAGVSLSAVSLALNNRPGVSEKTKLRVTAIAEQLGYLDLRTEKKHSAKKQVVKVLKIIRHGRTINSSHSGFIDAYIDGIDTLAKDSDVSLEISTFGQDIPMETIIQKITDAAQIMGYLIIGTELSLHDIERLLGTGRPMVFMDVIMDFIPADFIDMNNTDEVYTVISHLVEKGHKK